MLMKMELDSCQAYIMAVRLVGSVESIHQTKILKRLLSRNATMLPSPQDRALMTLCRLSNQGSVKGGAGHLWNHILRLNLVRIRHIMHSLAGTWAGWDGLAQIVWLAGIWWVGSRLAGIWASWGLG